MITTMTRSTQCEFRSKSGEQQPHEQKQYETWPSALKHRLRITHLAHFIIRYSRVVRIPFPCFINLWNSSQYICLSGSCGCNEITVCSPACPRCRNTYRIRWYDRPPEHHRFQGSLNVALSGHLDGAVQSINTTANSSRYTPSPDKIYGITTCV